MKPVINHDTSIMIWKNDESYSTLVEIAGQEKMYVRVFNACDIQINDTVIIEVNGFDAIYQAPVKVQNIVPEEEYSICVFDYPLEYGRIQRRNLLRVTDNLLLLYKFTNIRERWQVGRILDLSGSGLKISVEEQLYIKTILDLKFELAFKEISRKFTIKGEVVRKIGSPQVYKYGIKFIDIKPGEQDQIIQYVLRRSIQKRI